jgi:hypothetical protein
VANVKWLTWITGFVFLAALPASNNFKMDSYGFGSGGTADSGSSNYRVNGTAGEVAGSSSSSNFRAWTGEKHVKEANVPTATLTNPNNYYNKLRLVIGPENNPTDAIFAVAISTDNFASDIRYVKSDFTIGTSLTLTDYLTYAGWGSGTGQLVRGLTKSTVYTVKAKAFHGDFSESPYGPTSSAATVDPQISFDIDVAATDINTNPPYQINFGNLVAGSVADAPQLIWVDLDTNAESGAKIFVSGLWSGLRSSTASYTIASATGDIGAANEGFGAQGASATQSADGPLTLVAPYNGAGQNVGVTDTVIRNIFSTVNPISGGRGSFLLKAKSQTMTPASSDYTETLTAIAAGSF